MQIARAWESFLCREVACRGDQLPPGGTSAFQGKEGRKIPLGQLRPTFTPKDSSLPVPRGMGVDG